MSAITEKIRTYISHNNREKLEEIVKNYHPVDIAKILEKLEIDEIVKFFRLIKLSEWIDIFEELDHELQKELLFHFRTDRAGFLLDEMPPDERADLFEDMDEVDVNRFLSAMSYAEANNVQELIKYKPDTAGGLMTTEFAPLKENMTVKEALNFLREHADEFEQIYYAYVVDDNNKLKGVVTLKNIVLNPDDKLIKEIMNPNVVSVKVDTDQEEVARIMSEYDFYALPVVDDEGIIKGIITVDDVMDVLKEEATEDIEKFGGVTASEKPYLESNILSLLWHRLPWLVGFLFISSISSLVLNIYQKNYNPNLFGLLMIYLPMLAGTAGNAGTQSASIFIRGLATDEFKNASIWQLLFRELIIGTGLGIVVSIFAFFRTIFTLGNGDAFEILKNKGFLSFTKVILMGKEGIVAISVAIATMLAVILATFIGAFLPILFKKIKLDPAVMSGPFLATLMDISGILIYFNTANLIFFFYQKWINVIISH